MLIFMPQRANTHAHADETGEPPARNSLIILRIALGGMPREGSLVIRYNVGGRHAGGQRVEKQSGRWPRFCGWRPSCPLEAGLTCQSTRPHNSRRRLRRLCWWFGHFYVKFRHAPNYFVDTINYSHMGRTKAHAEHQKSRA